MFVSRTNPSVGLLPSSSSIQTPRVSSERATPNDSARVQPWIARFFALSPHPHRRFSLEHPYHHHHRVFVASTPALRHHRPPSPRLRDAVVFLARRASLRVRHHPKRSSSSPRVESRAMSPVPKVYNSSHSSSHSSSSFVVAIGHPRTHSFAFDSRLAVDDPYSFFDLSRTSSVRPPVLNLTNECVRARVRETENTSGEPTNLFFRNPASSSSFVVAVCGLVRLGPPNTSFFRSFVRSLYTHTHTQDQC